MYLSFVLLGRIMHWQSNSVSIVAAMGEATVHPPTGIWVGMNLEHIAQNLSVIENHYILYNWTPRGNYESAIAARYPANTAESTEKDLKNKIKFVSWGSLSQKF